MQAADCGSNKPCKKLPFRPVCAVQKLQAQEETTHVSFDNDCYFDVALCWIKANGGTITRKTSCDTVAMATAEAAKGDGPESRGKRSDHADCPEAEDCLIEPYEPVCASDGKTYANYCFFKLQRCTESRDLTFTHNGKCKATAKAESSKGDEVELRSKRSDHADCPEAEDCLIEPYQPVCASDDKTYANYCFFKLQRCTEDKDIKLVYSRKCV